jgi:hypothetical protein
MRRYICPRELLPVIESALAVEGYAAAIPPQHFDGGICVTVMSRGAAVVALHEDSSHDIVQINVYGDAQAGELAVLDKDLPRLFPPSLGRPGGREHW